MKDIFISYASEEIELAKSVCRLLENNGVSCFIAVRDICVGHEYAEDIVNAIDNAKAMVLLLSQNSNESPHVLREVERAVSHNVPVIVYMIEQVELNKSMEYFLMTHQWITDYENRDERLLNGVLNIINKSENVANQAQDITNQTQNITNLTQNITNLSQNIVNKDSASTITKNKKVDSKLILSIAIGAVCVAICCIVVVVLLVSLNKDSDSIADKNSNQSSNDISNEEANDSSNDNENNNPNNDKNNETSTNGDQNSAYELGDTITLGTYNDEPIEWRILHINDDNTAVVVSKYILSVKAFDTAEGGAYNEYDGVDYWSFENHIVTDPELLVLIRGNNDWSLSNIRTWLNSSKELVKYQDQAPTKNASCEKKNSYSEEPGFLYGFSEDERNAIVLSEHYTKVNELNENADSDGNIKTEDYVFLLSSDELDWFEEAGMHVYASATQAAIDKDTAMNCLSIMEGYDTENFLWSLRDSVEGNAALQKVVSIEAADDLINETFYAGVALGIRPAMVVDLSADVLEK